MKIWLRCHRSELCSWTIVWDALRCAFEKLGDNIHYAGVPDIPEDYYEIWWGDPQFWQWSTLPVKGKISLALSETRSLLAQGRFKALANLRYSDIIISPSTFASIAFREAPFDIPIYVVPFGVSPKEFSYTKRDWDGRLNFLHGGAIQFRKGSWLVPEAFVRAFSKKDNVKLVMQTSKVTEMFVKLKMEYSNYPMIEFSCKQSKSSFDIYKERNIYVSPHLSEGFGLMPLEAMATGMPCLVARCSAPLEYFSSAYGSWIEMSEQYAPVCQCLPDTGGLWRLPDIKSLVNVMREVYTNKEDARRMGAKASKYVLSNFTWEHTAKGIKKILKEVFE